MGDRTGIEWTDATWNPVVGCQIVSPGCTNCYAMKMAARIEASSALTGKQTHYRGLTKPSKAGAVWTGVMREAPQEILTQPLRWRRPRRIFVNSMSDLFAEGVSDETIDKVFAVMALSPQHTYQVLTKRSARMREYMSANDHRRSDSLGEKVMTLGYAGPLEALRWPLSNVWLGVSAEDQARADERIPDLLATPAAVRFVSAEPLLGRLELDSWLPGALECDGCDDGGDTGQNRCSRRDIPRAEQCPKNFAVYTCPEGPLNKYGVPLWITTRQVCLDWVIVGGESGPGARPMHKDWVRSIQYDCEFYGVPLFFKQWGEWTPGENVERRTGVVQTATLFNNQWDFGDENLSRHDGHVDDEPDLYRIGKKAAGRRLDGVEYLQWPQVAK